ncbi:3830_t:CDS:2 [Acaulospora morrowiae]|uniref:3830_t:CDS:1 n=1 Tax=Acaulospora morrowiae TaxID=94023 RepID=A0A9N8VPY4_9GLOM|nr:3830_t:CDS:2 [Acaulospora morrowiae]
MLSGPLLGFLVLGQLGFLLTVLQKRLAIHFVRKKPEVAYPNGIDKEVPCVFSIEPFKADSPMTKSGYRSCLFRDNRPRYVTDKVKNYWLQPGRAHDAIVIKIDPVPHSQIGLVPDPITVDLFLIRDAITEALTPVV